MSACVRLWYVSHHFHHSPSTAHQLTIGHPSAQELLNLNIVKGATEVVGAQELMGRVAITLKDYEDNPGKPTQKW